jgi:hypothetical protein
MVLIAMAADFTISVGLQYARIHSSCGVMNSKRAC